MSWTNDVGMGGAVKDIVPWEKNALFINNIEDILHAGVLTHPEVVHSLADSAVVLWDFLLEVLMEAWLHREELGKRWPIVLFG